MYRSWLPLRAHRPIALVTGATGALGPGVVRALWNSGYRVRTLSIDTADSKLFPDGVEVLTGDITNPLAVKSAMEDVEIIIHLAALLHVFNPSPDLRKKYKQVNVGGTTTVVEAAVQSGVKRVVLFSTIGVYGDSLGKILTEDSPPHPDTYYAETKLEAERIVLFAKQTDGRPLGTVLRLGAVYGPRVKGNYRRLLQSLARGRFIPIGDGCNRRTLIYDRDVAQAAVLAAEHPAAAGKIFNVSDGQFHTINDIISAICEALGRTPPRISLPISPVRWAVSIFEDVGRMIGYHSPIGRAVIKKYTEDIAVDSKKIQRELGFKPKYDLRSGWQETVEEIRLMGGL